MEPEGWRWHSFKNPQGRVIRFGSVAPKSGVPDAVVIVLQGMGEFTEKYFELAHDLKDRNLSFWMMDWQGQGGSHRHKDLPQKRYSEGFAQDIADLHYFIMEYVKHSAVHPDVGRIPLVMLGHSTGGNIGLRYLADHPDIFACAAFTAPLTGIRGLPPLPDAVNLALLSLLKNMMGMSYVYKGGKEWQPAMRDAPGNDLHSTDPFRKNIHNNWCLKNPSLQVGNVTYAWLYHALYSCVTMKDPAFAAQIKTPCLFALAGDEKIVSNAATEKLAARLTQAKILSYDAAKHEILMEKDAVRGAFLDAFSEFLRENDIRGKLKPF